MVYFLLSFLIIDLFRLLNHLFGIFPDFITQNPHKTKGVLAIIVVSVITIGVIAGHINTYFPVIKKYELKINKKGGKLDELNIAIASDIHLGTIIGNKKMRKFTEMINSLKPDIILQPGDIIDEDIKPLLKDNMGESLEKLTAKYGVYAVTGNHEYIGGVEPSVEFMEKHGINVIRDKSVFIDSSFYVAGREDLSISSFTDKKRKTLDEVIENINFEFPVILMDHQPFRLEAAQNAGVDLQLSGHTHHGQLWPFNFITKRVYELSWGYLQKGDTHYYVSCGVGGWGPPVRTNSRPEIINIKLRFAK
jgi:hypothetical protein